MTTRQAINEMPCRARAKRDRARRTLAVRAMAAEIAWLDGPLRWRDDRPTWIGSRGPLSPTADDLELAQQRLRQIGAHRRATTRAFGDATRWLARQAALLDVARLCLELDGTILGALVAGAERGEAGPIASLAPLLKLEAACLDPLPVSPSATLARCGEPAVPAIARILNDGPMPAARALAALTLGALSRALATTSRVPACGGDALAGWLLRAHTWGLRHGLPADPVPVALLLAEPDGPTLVDRWHRARPASGLFGATADLLRELLLRDATRAAGADGPAGGSLAQADVVGLAESLVAAIPLVRRILDYRPLLLSSLPSARGTRAALISRRRDEALEALGRARVPLLGELDALLREYLQAGPDPAAIRSILGALELTVGLVDLAEAQWPCRASQVRALLRDPAAIVRAGYLLLALQALLDALRQGLDLPPARRHPYLLVLCAGHGRIWDPAALPAEPERFGPWLGHARRAGWEPILALAGAGLDDQSMLLALRLGIQQALATYSWSDPRLCAWALTVARDLDLQGGYRLAYLLRRLSRYRDLAAAREALDPLFRATLAGEPDARWCILDALLGPCPLSTHLHELTPHVPRLLRWLKRHPDRVALSETLLRTILLLWRQVPDQATAWLEWLLAHLARIPMPSDRPGRLEQQLIMGVLLAEGDLAYFQLAVGLAHGRSDEALDLRKAQTLLERCPDLRPLLRAPFLAQPRRCLESLARLVALADPDGPLPQPLAELDLYRPPEPAGCPPAWQPLLDLVPALAGEAASYLQAQCLRGALPTLPRGVAAALNLPRTLAAELAYLERLPAGDLLRGGRVARLANLRARLQDPAALDDFVRAEVVERLCQATMLAQLAALEALADACLRARLRQVAGPLPANLPIDADLGAAALLSGNSVSNRKLLRRLLRAYIGGDRNGLAEHPANRRFLGQLAAGGVDVVAWLGSHPRIYPCSHVSGGRLHVRLERDPLRILQMGNLFNTCLSSDGFNAHAAIANACELNKRVIYAHDDSGRIVARQLLAINSEGGLVRYHIYCTLDEECAGAVRALIGSYARAFAARCRLALADAGEVPRLFAEAWYDDGAVPWSAESTPSAVATTHSCHPAG